MAEAQKSPLHARLFDIWTWIVSFLARSATRLIPCTYNKSIHKHAWQYCSTSSLIARANGFPWSRKTDGIHRIKNLKQIVLQRILSNAQYSIHRAHSICWYNIAIVAVRSVAVMCRLYILGWTLSKIISRWTLTDHIKSKKHLTNKEAKRKCDGAGTASSSSKQPCLLVCILRQHTASVSF